MFSANPEKGDFAPLGQAYPEKSDLWLHGDEPRRDKRDFW